MLLGNSLKEFLLHHNWTRIGLIGDSISSAMLYESLYAVFGPSSIVRVTVEEQLRLSVANKSLRPTDAEIDQSLIRMKARARIFILGFDTIFLGQYYSYQSLAVQVSHLQFSFNV